jgi:hypothetical protein
VLQQQLDAAIAHLQNTSPSDLEAALPRALKLEHRGGHMHFTGDQFRRNFAIPHFYFHIACAYVILRNRGIQLTMAGYLGSFNWTAAEPRQTSS